jgi:hypothetical protein
MANRQRDLYAPAMEQIAHHTALLQLGLDFAAFNARSWRLPHRFVANRCSVVIHGVGMADEGPTIPSHPDLAQSHAGLEAAGMTVCVESRIGEPGGPDAGKLETHVLLIETGAERLDSFPSELH